MTEDFTTIREALHTLAGLESGLAERSWEAPEARAALERVEAENARLREALERVANDTLISRQEITDLADAALNTGETE